MSLLWKRSVFFLLVREGNLGTVFFILSKICGISRQVFLQFVVEKECVVFLVSEGHQGIFFFTFLGG